MHQIRAQRAHMTEHRNADWLRTEDAGRSAADNGDVLISLYGVPYALIVNEYGYAMPLCGNASDILRVAFHPAEFWGVIFANDDDVLHLEPYRQPMKILLEPNHHAPTTYSKTKANAEESPELFRRRGFGSQDQRARIFGQAESDLARRFACLEGQAVSEQVL
jgi:hypothetical protein